MTRTAWGALSIGVALFIALIAWQGFGSIVATLGVAGWGLLLVAAFHLLPLVFDALAIDVLIKRRPGRAGVASTLRTVLLARWSGESVNSLMPAGQLGGPVLMVRHLTQRGMPAVDAAAVITVSTTFQTLAQMVFAALGIAAFTAYQVPVISGAPTVDSAPAAGLGMPLALVILTSSVLLYGFYLAQRSGLFGRAMRLFARLAKRLRSNADWSSWFDRADAADVAVRGLYRERRKAAASFLLSLVGWIVGTGEVWLALKLIGHPVSWVDALLLESLGQAIRGAAFFIPGSLGVQEGGYLLLAPLVGLPPEAALALSLIKRSREIILGVPGLVYLHFSERGWRRRATMPILDHD